ncbi:ABC transporter substrate-binding protein [Thorsellia anophelis]|uniref:Polar amino acid transport system substrate-binding protein n=1 Tax=Thorsellia anophelis DSM 18579 TaxID=1123402 RepID=A0A1I0EM02_9GAMM|nr:ABC transporter substrate-binding protein [Thorsellia anophelis]SET46218.1 polar amino acid transport system substrate-binding protein [Thorsellia anophelis DSM 18579]
MKILNQILVLLAFAVTPVFAITIDGQEISLENNKVPIRAKTNEAAINAISPEFRFANQGALTVAVAGLNSPPLYMFAEDNRTLVGSEVDMAQLIADSLGLTLKVVPTSWEDWPLGVASGKYDMAISNITVTKDRKKRFDFVTYRKDSLGFFVKSDSSINEINQAEDIAGLKIIVGSGTNQEAILLAWNEENIAKGLEAFTPIYAKDDAAQSLALQSGRADAFFTPYVMGAWKISQTGNTKLVGQIDGGWPNAAHVAVTLKKGSGLVDAVQIALNGVMQSGEYQQVLSRWGEGQEALSVAEINPPGLGD